jgi:outer membrane protein
MKRLTTQLIFCAALLLTNYMHAQTYSLKDCISIALENNQSAINSRLDIEASAYRIKEVKSALMANVNLTAQSLYYRELPAQYAPASSFGGPEGEYKKLTLGMEQNTSATLQISQNLYNHSVLTGLKAAKAAEDMVTLQSEMTRENIVYNVTATYYSIQILGDNLERLEENIRNLEKTTSINEVMKDNELVSENIHNRMLINLENLRNQYESQQLTQKKNLTTLKYLMNMDASAPLQVEPFDYNALLINSESGEISERTDIRLQRANIKLAQYDKKTIAAGYYPVLTNTTTFGYNGFNDTFSPFQAVNNDWIKTSSFALTLKVPVFDGFQKRNQLQQKQIAIQKNMNTLTQMHIAAEKEVDDAKSSFDANKNLLANSKKSLDLAEQLFESSLSEYENGITSLTELLNAQSDLTNARTNYSTALLNLKLAELSLQKANGKLLTNLL